MHRHDCCVHLNDDDDDDNNRQIDRLTDRQTKRARQTEGKKRLLLLVFVDSSTQFHSLCVISCRVFLHLLCFAVQLQLQFFFIFTLLIYSTLTMTLHHNANVALLFCTALAVCVIHCGKSR